jgi:ATP-dependent Zn protease
MSTSGGSGPPMHWPGQEGSLDARTDVRERETRRPMTFWDRSKIFLLLVGAWGFLFWSVVTRAKDAPIQAVFRYSVRAYWWLLALAGIELARQLHYLLSEQSPGYHRFWAEGVFGSVSRKTGRMNDWNRFRMARALKWLLWIAILDLILASAYHLHPAVAIFQAPAAFFQLLPLVLQIVLMMFVLILQFVALFWFLSRGGIDVYMPEDIKTRFNDVWGQDHVLEKVKENIVYLENPEAIEDRGGYVPAGILLWGPPGTGKTLMAEAVAGETGKPFVFVEPSAFINMFMGVGILKVKGLFRRLRKLALRYGGVIAFFDEADSLGNRGMSVAGTGDFGMSSQFSDRPSCHGISYLSANTQSLLLAAAMNPEPEPRRGVVNKIIAGMGMGGGGMGTLQALLSEMSGLKKPRGFFNRIVRRVLGMRPKPPPKYRILVMMASNMPQALDPALLRPGRIDRIYKVGYPSKAGRVKTYEGYLAKVRHNLIQEQVDKLATMTPYATGASIKDLVNEALIYSIREGRQWITWQDIIKARLLKALGPPEDVEYIERERHAVAIHEACHAVAAYRVRHHLVIDVATIEKGSDYLGMVASIPLEEQFTQWRTEYEADIMVALASLAGEKMFFDGDNSSGVTGDLNSATTVSMFMEGYWGMGRTIGSHGVVKRPVVNPITDTSRSLLESDLGRRIETMLGEILERTRKLLEDNRFEVLAVAHALETHKTLTGDDVAAIIEGTVGPLVDGRPYHAPDFVEDAEAYHRRAVEAHKVHGSVDIALPTFDGQMRVSAARPKPPGQP